MRFQESIKVCFSKYADFTGRATRSEYGWFFLCVLFTLGMLLPSIAAAARRLHPEQKGRWLHDGRYELRLPYGEDTELVMDVLRHAGQVEVVADAALRAAVKARLDEASRRFG